MIAIGAHDDLHRVLDFYETDETRAPDGTLLKMKAHEYGSLVTAYSHASAFFAPQDVAQARLTLRTLLWEHLPQAHADAAKLSPQGQARMAQLFAHDTKSLVADTRRGLAAVKPELDAASPHFYLAKVHVPVMLLHGSSDNVVPPTETLWLEHDLPAGVLRSALISPAIGHVEVGARQCDGPVPADTLDEKDARPAGHILRRARLRATAHARITSDTCMSSW